MNTLTAARDGRGELTETAAPRGVNHDQFRRTLALHAAGVAVITARDDGEPVGLTATSFTSVSLDPPLVSFYVGRSSTTWPRLRNAEHFGVNILAGHQEQVAARFARKGIDRFAVPTAWWSGPHGVPLLEDTTARLVLAPHSTAEVGDHILVVGLVVEATAGTGGAPLVYQRGRFGRFIPHRSGFDPATRTPGGNP